MRTYLAIGSADDSLVLKCAGCGDVTNLKDLGNESVRARTVGITSINTLRLAEYMGKYGMEHSSCPPPKD